METKGSLPFQELLNDYDDEVMEEIVHSGKFKVRKAWFMLVMGYLQKGVEQGKITDPETIDAIKFFIKDYATEDFRHRLTTAGDVQRTNSLLRKVLGREEL